MCAATCRGKPRVADGPRAGRPQPGAARRRELAPVTNRATRSCPRARLLNMATGTSKAQYHRARTLLEEWLGEGNSVKRSYAYYESICIHYGPALIHAHTLSMGSNLLACCAQQQFLLGHTRRCEQETGSTGFVCHFCMLTFRGGRKSPIRPGATDM